MNYIVLVGQRSAGKDTVADYLQNEYGLEQVVFSEELMNLGLEMGEITELMLYKDKKGTLSDWGSKLRQMENGSEMYISRVIEKAKQGYQIINGMRDNIELNLIHEELPDSMIWAVTADYFTRYRRTKDAGLTTGLLHFMKLERKPTEKYIRRIINREADVIIYNNSSLSQLYENVDSAVHDLKLFH